MNNWKDILISVLAFLVIGEGVFVGVFLLEKPEPIIKREIIEKITVITRIKVASPYNSGIASWYGVPENGRKTASGEVYDMNQLTCAHFSLPFGTQLLIINRSNDKSVIVTVTDRMPEIWRKRGRIIDLSLASAEKLNMVEAGLAPVEIKILKNYK